MKDLYWARVKRILMEGGKNTIAGFENELDLYMKTSSFCTGNMSYCKMLVLELVIFAVAYSFVMRRFFSKLQAS